MLLIDLLPMHCKNLILLLSLLILVAKPLNSAGADQSPTVVAQSGSPATADKGSPNCCYRDDNVAIVVGLQGVVRLGKWTPITVTALQGQTVTEILVETRDGQDRRVVYDCRPQSLAEGNVWQGLIRLGRPQTSVVVTLVTQAGALEYRVPIDSLDIVSATTPLVLSIESGSEIGDVLQAGAASESVAGLQSVTRVVNDVSQLPSTSIGYDAVAAVYITTDDVELIDSLTEPQLDALERWGRGGGRLVISADPNNYKRVFGQTAALSRFVVGQVVGVGQLSNSSRLESFVGSREQLVNIGGDPIPIVKLKQSGGRVWVGTENREPLVTQYPLGLGDVVFASFDLKSDRFDQWKSYPTLVRVLQRIKKSTDRENKQSIATLGGASLQTGFSDLMGQLRAPLEQFSRVGFLPFTAIALLITLYILCIGPLDYFLLRKLLGRMELTWITFPLFSLLFCGLAIGLSRSTRPAATQINQLEIVDIDSATRDCRGAVWSNIYSPGGCSIDVNVPAENGLGVLLEDALVSWHGQPGQGLGGMSSGSRANSLTAPYRHAVDGVAGQSALQSFGIPVASSRALFTSWTGKISARTRSTLKYRQDVEQLYGTVKNPLDVELVNVRLLHGDWAYILDDSLEPGDAFDVETNTEDRPLSSILNRKFRSSDEKEYRVSGSRWELTEMNVGRIAEVLMLYDAAGGQSYTGLSHAYQGSIDMSDALLLGQAILVGEVQQQTTCLKISGDGQGQAPEYDQVTTIVRIVLPVQAARSR